MDEPSPDEIDLDLFAMIAAAEFDGKRVTSFKYVEFPDLLEINLADGLSAKFGEIAVPVKLCSIEHRDDNQVIVEYEIQIPDKKLIIRVKI